MSISSKEICFILHTFIPAKIAAWSYYERGSRTVRVDSLWGLPDGLQFLPHDSFQIDLESKKILSEKIRFKPHYLKETADGKWRYLPVRTDLARHKSIARSDLIFIALQTAKIAERLKDTSVAQVMWFCDVPQYLNIGRNIAWYRERKQTSDLADIPPARPLLPTITLKSVSEIDRLLRDPTKAAVLRLEPQAEAIRNTSFIERVAELAKARSCPVELSGSVLCHAYYLLKSNGVTVYSEEPYASHYRQRGRKVFEKLVRDKIPENISSKGELVIDARLENQEIRNALVGKLFEEAEEFLSAGNPEASADELADLLEIIRGLATNRGVSFDEILKRADDKKARRGGFEDGIILIETALHSPTRSDGHRQRIAAPRLSDMIRTRRRAGGFSIPLLALMDAVQTGGITVPLKADMHALRLRIRAGTLEVAEVAANPEPAQQLRLPVDDQALSKERKSQVKGNRSRS